MKKRIEKTKKRTQKTKFAMELPDWSEKGARLLRHKRPRLSLRSFHQHFGVFPCTLTRLWPFLLREWPAKPSLVPSHLLLALWYLRVYPTDNTMVDILGNASRARKVIWPFFCTLATFLPFVSAFFFFFFFFFFFSLSLFSSPRSRWSMTWFRRFVL